VDLVLGRRARLHQLGATREPAAQHLRALVGHPDRVELADGEQLRERAGVEPVGLRARLRDAGVTWIDHDDPAHVCLQDARDLPRVAGDLQRHLVIDDQAGREHLQRFRRRVHAPARDEHALLEDRDLAEVAMHVQSDVTHAHLHHQPRHRRGEPAGQTT
jgi:hypothetical protein